MAANIVIIQARTGSTRLPGKVLLKILGKEILLHLIDRVITAKKVDHVIIATTINPADNIIVDLVNNYHKNVSVFRGSEEDVLDRYYQAALSVEEADPEKINIIRITSDCPLIDPRVIDMHIAEFGKKEVDYLSSRIEKRSWPHGMEVEVFKFTTLYEAWKNATKPVEREHVTPFIYLTSRNKFKLFELSHFEDLSHLRFTLDYWEDYLFIKVVYEKLYPRNPMFTFSDILDLLDHERELLSINSNRNDPKIL
jgi:spore coat polysaccharide biosynthesis protein SpsF